MVIGVLAAPRTSVGPPTIVLVVSASEMWILKPSDKKSQDRIERENSEFNYSLRLRLNV